MRTGKLRKVLCALYLTVGMFLGPAFSHAALLSLTPNEPTIDFGGSGIIDYNATTGLVTISGVPATLFQADPFLFGEVLGTGVDDEKLITIQFSVGTSGNFVTGITGPDLIIKGSIDVDFDTVPDYDGVLLEAEVTQFGFEDGVSGGDDAFDLRLTSVTGALAPLYSGRDLAVRVVSEVSTEFPSPFSGSYTADFVGQAKGIVGATDPIQVAACELDVEATCSVNGGPNKSKCRIKTTKSPKHWEHQEHSYKGKTWRHSKYGMHGNPIPSWAARYTPTNVKFTYVITNIGTTSVSDLMVTDSFDTPVSGVPATLAVGASVTLMRTESLYEEMENTVTVMGEYLTAVCADHDVVIVKNKLRDRRRHDSDDYKDKGEGHDD